MISSLILLLILSIIFSLEDKILLRKIEVITLRKGSYTTGRRSSLFPEIQCNNGCESFFPNEIQCYNGTL